MEIEEFLDWQLEVAKTKPMEINHNFNKRFEIWVDQILPGRLNSVRKYNSQNYTLRMINLTMQDSDRLYNRAIFEHKNYPVSYIYRISTLFETTNKYIREFIEITKEK